MALLFVSPSHCAVTQQTRGWNVRALYCGPWELMRVFEFAHLRAGTWRATPPGISAGAVDREVGDSRPVWGLPHLELSNGGRVQHGVAAVGKNLLRGLPHLRAHPTQASGESVGGQDEAKKLDEQSESYPQRWRVAGGEGKYEETSALRFLDGWAETYPAVVDASSGFVGPRALALASAPIAPQIAVEQCLHVPRH